MAILAQDHALKIFKKSTWYFKNFPNIIPTICSNSAKTDQKLRMFSLKLSYEKVD